MDVAVIGAGGEVGREMCAQVIESGLAGPKDDMCLVGHVGGPSELGVFGLLVDLADAFAERAPRLRVTFDPADLRGHLIIFVAGASLPHDYHDSMTRQQLARRNLPVFRSWAQQLAANTDGDEMVIVQSNPVELAVEVLAAALGPARVIGGGALNDSLRLRRELAIDAGVRRPDVTGMVLGQHGPNSMTAWSQVAVRGWDGPQLAALIGRITRGRDPAGFPAEMAAARRRVIELLAGGRGQQCIEYLRALPADLRAAIKPFFVHYTGRTTAVVTAHSVVELAAALSSGAPTLLPAQVALDGAWTGFATPIGVPVALGDQCWRPVAPDLLDAAELRQLREIHNAVAADNAAALAGR